MEKLLKLKKKEYKKRQLEKQKKILNEVERLQLKDKE